jgi:hypothetical protein
MNNNDEKGLKLTVTLIDIFKLYKDWILKGLAGLLFVVIAWFAFSNTVLAWIYNRETIVREPGQPTMNLDKDADWIECALICAEQKKVYKEGVCLKYCDTKYSESKI